MSLKKTNHTTTPDRATAGNTTVAAGSEVTTARSTAPMRFSTKPHAQNQDLHEQATNRTRTRQAKDTKSIRRALRRLDLAAYYAAVNARYFGGKLPADVKVVWKTGKNWDNKDDVWGYTQILKGWKQRIVFNLDKHVESPRELLNTMVHECIHVASPFGDVLNRKSSYGDTTLVRHGHGEDFGGHCRRINAQLGYKLFGDRECSYGMAGKKWAQGHVVVECDDYIWAGIRGLETAPSCDHKCTKRQMRAHKKWHMRQYEAWYEEFGEAHSAYEDFSIKVFKEQGILDDDQAWSLYQAELLQAKLRKTDEQRSRDSQMLKGPTEARNSSDFE